LRKLLRYRGVYPQPGQFGSDAGKITYGGPGGVVSVRTWQAGVPDIIGAVKALRYAGIVTVAALVGVVACTSERPVKHVAKDTSHRKSAPDFALKDANGKVVHLADYKGKVVLLDFWATWCGPCKIEIPWFQEFQRKYKDRGFEVLGVSMDDDGWKSVMPFVQEKKINYRIVMGDDKTGDQFGGLEALPTTFVIDRNGRIASVHVGLTNKKDFSDAIEELLEDPVGGISAGVALNGADGAAVDHRAGSHS
jgi:peroxiredoxin